MTRNGQASLFDRGDAQVVTERGASEAACGFCAIIRGEAKATLIDENDRLMSFLDHRPLFHGHVLLIPKLHVRLMSELPVDRVQEFFVEAQRLESAVETGLGADGSMILINNVVSQSVPHLHLHVVPRRKKDGLRFWLGPRHPYDAVYTAESYAERIRAALSPAPTALMVPGGRAAGLLGGDDTGDAAGRDVVAPAFDEDADG